MRTRAKGRVDYVKDLAVVGTGGQWIVLGILLCLLVVLPLSLKWTGNLNWLTFLNFTLLTIIAALGLNITTGMAGMVNMGQSGFVMVGGYALGTLILGAGVPFWAALAAAVIITGLAGLLVALPVIRLKGFYVAVATLAFFYVAQFILRNLGVTGGTSGLSGIPQPSLGAFIIKTDVSWYYLLLIFCVLAILASINISRSRLGRSFLTIRDNEDAAASLGINVPLTKLRAFFVGSLFAGLAGGLWAGYVSLIRMDQFSIWDSIWLLAMIIIGGQGSTAGAVMGVLFLNLVSRILHVVGTTGVLPLSANITAYITYAIYGLIIVIFITFQPYGLNALWQKFKINYKRWPFGV